jgi:hypothetical protein
MVAANSCSSLFGSHSSLFAPEHSLLAAQELPVSRHGNFDPPPFNYLAQLRKIEPPERLSRPA